MNLLQECRREIMISEGFETRWYKCPQGKETIGHGLTNLTELELLIISNIRNKKDSLKSIDSIDEFESEMIVGYRLELINNHFNKFNWYRELNRTRKKVIIDMAYNIGINGTMKFKKMIAALEKENYCKAAYEIKDSSYYRKSYSINYSYNRRAELNYQRMKNGDCNGRNYSTD